MNDFSASVNPNHVALGLPPIVQTAIQQPLVGHLPHLPSTINTILSMGHMQQWRMIATCHNGNYAQTPNTCAACHTDDYLATTNPNHVAAQFPNDCASCHSEQSWVPSNFNHDGQYFPIYSGSHNGQWTQCVDCHSNPSNYAQVVCITCHQNPETNDQHQTVGGYVPNNAACLACHPQGEATGSTFQPQCYCLPTDGRSHRCGLHPMSCQWLSGYHYCLRRLSHG